MADEKPTNLTPPATSRRSIALRRPLTARYDSAQSGADNRRHWGNADMLDPVRSNMFPVRRLLRNRARYEVANNSYAKGIVLTLANDVIGIGPRLQMLTDKPETNQLIEREFAAWSKAVDFPGKLRTMRMSRAQDGEAFALLYSNASMWPVTLDIRLLEADQVETPALATVGMDSRYYEGVRFDNNGNPIAYCVLRNHPGGLYPTMESDEIAGDYMVHWFRTDRPGQVRGVPEITPALPLFAQLRRYTLAVLSASELAAEWTLFLKTNAPAGGEAANITDGAFAEIEIERGVMTNLPDGWEPFQLNPTQPVTSYDMFKREILNEIARCLNMPFNIAACNSSGYNYSSGRLDHQTYYKSIRVEQAQCEAVVLDRILNAWLDEAEVAFGLNLEERPHQWFWEGHEHIDPSKEADAQQTRLTSNMATFASEYAKQGKDWETELRQRAREVKLMKELGLDIPVAPPVAAPNDKQPVPVGKKSSADESGDEVSEGDDA